MANDALRLWGFYHYLSTHCLRLADIRYQLARAKTYCPPYELGSNNSFACSLKESGMKYL